MALRPPQEAFVREYQIDSNASAAARRAGYSAAGARVRGVELMANPEVREAIEERQAALAEQAQLTAEDVRDGLLKEATTAPEASVRVRAWELLGKHLGFFPRDGATLVDARSQLFVDARELSAQLSLEELRALARAARAGALPLGTRDSG